MSGTPCAVAGERTADIDGFVRPSSRTTSMRSLRPVAMVTAAAALALAGCSSGDEYPCDRLTVHLDTTDAEGDEAIRRAGDTVQQAGDPLFGDEDPPPASDDLRASLREEHCPSGG